MPEVLTCCKAGQLPKIRQQADDVGSARHGQPAVERDNATTIPPCQAKEISVRNEFARGCRPDLGQDGGRYRIRPPRITPVGDGQEKQAIRHRCRLPPAAGQLRTDSNYAQLRHGAGRPTFRYCILRKSIQCEGMMLVLGHEQRDQHIYIK